jgi:hypothetical protein
MTEKKLLQTHGREKERETLEPTPKKSRILTTNMVKDAKLDMSDKEFVLRYGTDEDCAAVRKDIEKRLAKTPKHTYWICKNPHCGHRERSGPNMTEPMCCFRCNKFARVNSPGWMRPMSKREIKAFEKDQAANFKRAVERDKAEAKKFKAFEEARLRGLTK